MVVLIAVTDPALPKPVVKLPSLDLRSLSKGKAIAPKHFDGVANVDPGGQQKSDNLIKIEENTSALRLLLCEPLSQFDPSGRGTQKPRRKADESYGRLNRENHEGRRSGVPLLPNDSSGQFGSTGRVPTGPRWQKNPDYGRLKEFDKPDVRPKFPNPTWYSAQTLLPYRPTSTTREYTMPGPCNLQLSDLTLSAFHQLFCSANPTARPACPWDTVLAMYRSYVYSCFASNDPQAKLLRHVAAAYRRVCWNSSLYPEVMDPC